MQHSRSISAFDLDHTLLSGNSSFLFGKYLCKQKYLSRKNLYYIFFCYFLYYIGILSIKNLHKNAFRYLFNEKSASEVKGWVDEFLAKYLKGNLYSPALNRLEQAQIEGHYTVILSSSPDFLVGPIAQRLGVSHWQATQYGVDKDGQFCHIAKLMLGEDKAQFLKNLSEKRGCHRHDLTVYSDSYLDMPALLTAGMAVGVNPDRKLRAICRERQWPII